MNGDTPRPHRHLLPGTPLRIKLIAAVLGLVTIALVLTGAASATALRSYLLGQVDRQLASVASSVPQFSGGFGGGPADPFASPDTYVHLAVPGTTGRTWAAATVDPPTLPTGVRASALPASGRFVTVDSESGRRSWRVLIVPIRVALTDPFGSPQVTTGVLFVAQSLGPVDLTVARLVLVELVVGVVALMLLGLLGFALVRRSLRPLEEVENTAAAIAAGDLSRRVPVGEPGTEVGSLAESLNSMLTQIEQAFDAQQASEQAARASEDRMRRFVADASHELRTPLTSIRGYAELYRQTRGEDEADVEHMMGRIEDAATRMGVLVEDLLLLARLDQARPLDLTHVDMATIAADVVADARALTDDHDLSLDVEPDSDCVVIGDATRLRQVVANLVSNALTHTPAGTAVSVQVGGGEQGQVLIRVRDTGPGLSQADADRVFERFFRADASRTRARGGSGLGLSIVAALVAAHHGRVGVETAPGYGATFWVSLPLAAALEVADPVGEDVAV